jgi:hypothetical protein
MLPIKSTLPFLTKLTNHVSLYKKDSFVCVILYKNNTLMQIEQKKIFKI